VAQMCRHNDTRDVQGQNPVATSAQRPCLLVFVLGATGFS